MSRTKSEFQALGSSVCRSAVQQNTGKAQTFRQSDRNPPPFHKTISYSVIAEKRLFGNKQSHFLLICCWFCKNIPGFTQTWITSTVKMLGPTRTNMVINWVTDEFFAIFKINKLSVYTSLSKDTYRERKTRQDAEIHFLIFCYVVSKLTSNSL